MLKRLMSSLFLVGLFVVTSVGGCTPKTQIDAEEHEEINTQETVSERMVVN